MLSPILEKIAKDPTSKTGSGLPIDLVTVDIDRETALAEKYKASFDLSSLSCSIDILSVPYIDSITADCGCFQGRKGY